MDSMCVPVCPKNSGFVTGLDFKDIKLEIFTKSKINFIGISVFGYEDKKISNLCLKKCCEEKNHYVLFKDFNTFMYYTIHQRKKHFYYLHYLLAFSTEGMLKRRITDWFKNYGKQRIKMHKKGE